MNFSPVLAFNFIDFFVVKHKITFCSMDIWHVTIWPMSYCNMHIRSVITIMRVYKISSLALTVRVRTAAEYTYVKLFTIIRRYNHH
jgi:hypothetical protein